ncbi:MULTISPECIES: hypothetical protein [Paenibacillus]|uniref:Regulatory protein YrvL n=1 Tax=Paenibacillus pabuli TaxID=1472 RepID=A0ABX9BCB5_9BACL|nr:MULTISPECIES: hypothetical protein [Paenibacillus]RAI85659.1 hypothetical protein DET54_12114 [Paenibacillus pabuli]SEL29246.1 hypothetical protein SAMN05518856_109172 [Paenibacillus sp. OK003]
MPKFLVWILVCIVGSILLQIISVGLLESSILGNLPILGKLLMFFDIGFLIYYMNDGVTVNNLVVFTARAVSLYATIYTIIFMSKIEYFQLKLDFGNSIEVKVTITVIAIIVNFAILFVASSIAIPIAELYEKAIIRLYQVIDEMKSLTNGFE